MLNTAAVLLTAYGNVPPERAAPLTGMLLETPVSAAGSRTKPVPGCRGSIEVRSCWAMAG